jgi:hypothetical protein
MKTGLVLDWNDTPTGHIVLIRFFHIHQYPNDFFADTCMYFPIDIFCFFSQTEDMIARQLKI